MAKRITWTDHAISVYNEILEFYYQRNGTKKHSSELNKEIRSAVKLLIKYPLLGKKTEFEDIRILIKGHYKIFYRLLIKEIVILLVWDCRRDSETLIRL